MNSATYKSYLNFIRKIANKRKLHVFLVGGFLRDVLLGRESFDLDFAVERNAISFARKFSRDIKGAFILLDEERGCARVAKKQKGKLYTFDFADFREETFKKDLLCRDFSINTLALDVFSGGADFPDGIIDLRGAKQDLKKKSIRMVSVKAFQQDSLR
ncbi:MAG: hypothetical protein KAS17_09610, partial [Victivallaceae bacterium]|nr:hypothetical protein [Victivallaceae bacterium]